MLTGGDPRSLEGVKAVVVRVLDDEDLLPELFDCVFSDDEVVRMRAADALEKVCVQQPDRLQPYVGRLLGEVAAIDQPSVRWHLAQMLGEISLGRDDRSRAVALLQENLVRADDWIVINSSLSALVALARGDDELTPYVLQQLERFEQDPQKAVAKRASTLRGTL